MTRSLLKFALLALALIPFSAPNIAQAGTVRVYVTNSAGDNIHVVDPATNQVVPVFKGPEAAHGVAFSSDGARVYGRRSSQTHWHAGDELGLTQRLSEDTASVRSIAVA